MTIFAGVVSRDPDLLVPQSVCSEISLNISRNPTDFIHEFKSNYGFFAKVDIGSFGDHGVCNEFENSISMVNGDPILQLEDLSSSRKRSEDLRFLHQNIIEKKYNILKHCRGTYCAFFYDMLSEDVYLVSDKLGIRPIYYWISQSYIVFSSTLRVLENLSLISKEIDFKGISEAIIFGEPLSDRTFYKNISVLESGEVVNISRHSVRHIKYWSWDQVVQKNRTQEESLEKVFSSFSNAIDCRLGTQKTTVAFLSGGLDSRVIVGALREKNVAVHTLNFAPKGTQDQVFGAEFGKAIGSHHQEIYVDSENNFDRRMAASHIWQSSEVLKDLPPERPNLVWSGDGGSVGLGHVYLSELAVDLVRKKGVFPAIGALIDYNLWQFPGAKALNSPYSEEVKNFPFDGIKSELEKIRCSDPGRSLYLFLMVNDQRRHLAGHFEDIDLCRLEFQLPFFDGKFLESICEIPVDDFLLHRFYVKWLKLFLPAVTSVPWQAYPGHEPCPLEVPKNLRYQWEGYFDNRVSKKIKSKKLKTVEMLLKSESFQESIFDKSKLKIALFLTRCGLKDYTYAFKFLEKYSYYFEKCSLQKNTSKQ